MTTTHIAERRKHPIDAVVWRDPATLKANHYNPNHVFGPEMALLALSIVEDGWTAAITITEEDEIVDGFHRWTLGSKHDGVREASGGLVPCVVVRGKTLADRMIATIRQNRARGRHGVLKMSAIVRTLQSECGLSHDEVKRRLGMDNEELVRLTDVRGSPDKAGQESFGKGWVPAPTETTVPTKSRRGGAGTARGKASKGAKGGAAEKA